MEQLQQLGYTQRNIARNIEKTQYKLNNAETAVDFNKSCILNGLLPKYIYTVILLLTNRIGGVKAVRNAEIR